MNVDFLPAVSWQSAAAFAAAAAVVLLAVRAVVGPPVGIARRTGLLALRLLVVAAVAALVVNPVWVDESPGPVERPEVYYLLDTSQSMAMGTGTTRWDDALRTIREAEDATADAAARVSAFQFGQRFAVVDGGDAPQASLAETGSPLTRALAALRPADADSRLVPALRQLSSRFGRSPPASVVLFSDGRIRDADGVDAIAEHYKRQGVPIHVVPVGASARGGDIAVVAVVAPARVRKYSSSDVQVFLRSFGYDGRRTEVRLEGRGENGEPVAVATPVPVTLRDGVQSVLLNFRSDLEQKKLRVVIPAEPDEVSDGNNAFPLEVAVDRTKVRVLYVEGSRERMRAVRSGDTYELRGPHTDLQKALTEDPDIECVVIVTAGGTRRQRLTGQQGFDTVRGFPETVAELAAFDAIVLSNVQRDAFTDQELEWIDQWVSRRGGGLCMVGGENSFGAGGWGGTPLEAMLPVEIGAEQPDWVAVPVSSEPQLDQAPHAVWHLLSDAKQNREVVEAFPDFVGIHRGLRAKPNLTTVLATASTGEADPLPLLAAGQYGKGRTLSLSAAITAPWANDFTVNWGRGDNRYYAKFWRNAVYWLTENSSIGRRRLVITADKRFYRPGETIALQAIAYDEGAARTTNYRIAAMIEPQSSLVDLDSLYSPVLWPNGLTRTSGEDGPNVAWGEEFDLPKRADQKDYHLSLDVSKVLPPGSEAQSLRVEVTAYEDFTQVDSTSVDVQILHDPFESQNPLPDHELLARVAETTGGRVLESGRELADVLGGLDVRVGAPVVSKEPMWSRWPVLAALLGLLTTEWLWRRGIGLA